MEKDRRIKILSIVALLIAVAGLTIAFAAMSKTLTINGTATMDTAVWDIHFDSAKMQSKKGDAKEVQAPQITNGGIDLVLKVSLRKPKDEIVYNALIKNAGDIDAEIESIEYPVLNEDQKKILEFEATYEDGTEITEKQELNAKEDMTVKIVIRYKDITDESLLATEAYDIPLTFKINYVQKGVGNNIPGMPEVDDGTKAVLVHNAEEVLNSDDPTQEPFFNSPIARGLVETLTFSEGTTERSGNTWDASASGDKSIIGYYEDSDGNNLYEVYIESESNIYAPANSIALFGAMASLKEINFNNFKTNDTTIMTYMFAYDASLKNLNLSLFNTSNVKDMNGMFLNCSNLTNLDLSSFNTSNVTTMEDMFGSCTSLTSLNVSSFNTSNVTDMSLMFYECAALTSINLNSFDVSSVTDMEMMFFSCKVLEKLDLSKFNTENVIDMSGMFEGCKTLTELKFNSADFNKVDNYEAMFGSISNLIVYVKDQVAADFIEAAIQKGPNATGTVEIQPLQS